jgi:3D (Asp-Asp-Asp) domain-containing protein
VWQFNLPVDLHNNYRKTSVAIQLTCGSPQELLQTECGNSIDLWISTRITANWVWQFNWLVDLHKNYCKLSVAIQLTCGSPQELLQNKCVNSIDLWISTRITVNWVWQFNWLVDLHKNYCKTSVAIQLTCGSPQELLQNVCGNSIDLWISTRITANWVWQFNWPVDLHKNYCKQVWQFSWLVDLHKNYCKLSVAIQLTCGSPQELLQNKCGNSVDLWIYTRVTANNIRRRNVQKNYGGQMSA